LFDDFSFSIKYFSKNYTNIGTYWEKKNQNEIDIVAINEETKTMLLAEVKINKDKINIDILKEKSKKIVEKFGNYSVEYKGYSLDDM
jgi:hypothetical protein